MSFLLIHSSQVFEGVLYCDLLKRWAQIMEVTVFQKNDLVTSRSFKNSTFITSGPLSTILNASIIQVCWVNCWKKSQVASVFKKDDEFSRAKYIFYNTRIPWFVRKITCCSYKWTYFNGIVADSLIAYRKYFKCKTALLEHRYYGCSDINKSRRLLIALHPTLCLPNSAYGLNVQACFLLRDYFDDTYLPWIVITKKTPRESVLGRFFFSTLINEYIMVLIKLNYLFTPMISESTTLAKIPWNFIEEWKN